MSIAEIVKQLKEERMRIDAALVALTMTPPSNGKVVAPARRKRRKMSAAGRKKIAEAQRKRWAKQKVPAAGK